MPRKKKPKLEHVTVVGRRWWDSKNGNTYSSAVIFVTGKNLEEWTPHRGVVYLKSGPVYGYDQFYLQLAVEHLKEVGLISEEMAKEPFHCWHEKFGITVAETVADVATKKQL